MLNNHYCFFSLPSNTMIFLMRLCGLGYLFTHGFVEIIYIFSCISILCQSHVFIKAFPLYIHPLPKPCLHKCIPIVLYINPLPKPCLHKGIPFEDAVKSREISQESPNQRQQLTFNLPTAIIRARQRPPEAQCVCGPLTMPSL